jgi:hypothetical protein
MGRKILVSAGEASGDLYASLVVQELRRIWPDGAQSSLALLVNPALTGLTVALVFAIMLSVPEASYFFRDHLGYSRLG